METIKRIYEKIEDNWEVIIIVLVFLALLSLCAGGWVFYYFYKFPGNVWLCIELTFQNCLETLLCNPVLPIQDIADEKNFIKDLNGLKYFCILAYKIAMIAVPMLEVIAVFCILDHILHVSSRFTRKKQRILIVGYNERVRKLLNKSIPNAKIYLWVDNLLSEEEERSLYFKNIMVIKDLNSNDRDTEKSLKSVDRFNKFLQNYKITDVILLNESDFRNIEYYIALSSCSVCETHTIHFFVLIKNFEMSNMLQEYFDKKLYQRLKLMGNKTNESFSNTHMDLRIFNFYQLQAEKMFFDQPLFYGENSTDRSIHLLIIGGGDICEQILIHAMNQGVMTSENEILIDVIDDDILSFQKRLENRFNLQYVKHIKDGVFQILPDKSDGRLIIRLSNCNFNDDTFIQQVLKNSNYKRYTYIVFCLPNPEKNLHCLLQVKKSIENNPDDRISIAVRLTDSKENAAFLNTIVCGSFARVYLMGENEEMVGIDQIVNSKEEIMSRIYHMHYNHVAHKYIENINYQKDEDRNLRFPDLLWNCEEYYKRESNRALYFHQNVKQYYLETLGAKRTIYNHEINQFIKTEKGIKRNALEWSEVLLEREDNGELKYHALVEIAKTEHRRFNYFYASNGWGYSKEKKPEEKLHDCLCKWEELVKTRKDVLIYDLISNPSLFNEKL